MGGKRKEEEKEVVVTDQFETWVYSVSLLKGICLMTEAGFILTVDMGKVPHRGQESNNAKVVDSPKYKQHNP